ncbi:MAG: hypothetical protein JWM47_3143 [Acidimicrobiales bacterium]|nr:hypothetical protein [Acidimicrobiales bacterium]
MSPVAPSGNHVGRAAVVSLVGVIVLISVLGLATLAFKGRNSPDLPLGDQTFQGGSTERLAAEIADRGPIVYGDVSGRKDRDIVLQHLGTDPDEGWYAFLAAPVNKSRECTWQWQEDEELFRAKCDRDLTAPADGKGLPQFTVTVSNGTLDIDLNADARPASTTTTASTPAGS